MGFEFGMFHEFQRPAGISDEQAFATSFEQVDAAERWGLDAMWLAEQPGSPVAQRDVKERLLQAYFHDGLDIGDPDVLATCAAEVGFDHDAVRQFLDSDDGMHQVRDDIEQAIEYGITGVPAFVINGRWSIPGAQDTDTFVNVFRQLKDRIVVESAPVCEDDICDV